MDKRLWTAIQELLDEAEYAVTALDRYQDWMDDPFDLQPAPNAAMVAYSGLKSAYERVNNMMPPDPETPHEIAVARAEYEEDR